MHGKIHSNEPQGYENAEFIDGDEAMPLDIARIIVTVAKEVLCSVNWLAA